MTSFLQGIFEFSAEKERRAREAWARKPLWLRAIIRIEQALKWAAIILLLLAPFIGIGVLLGRHWS